MAKLTKEERVRNHIGNLITDAMLHEEESLTSRIAIRSIAHCGGSVWVELSNGDAYKIVVEKCAS